MFDPVGCVSEIPNKDAIHLISLNDCILLLPN
jgi:hypothetical protein